MCVAVGLGATGLPRPDSRRRNVRALQITDPEGENQRPVSQYRTSQTCPGNPAASPRPGLFPRRRLRPPLLSAEGHSSASSPLRLIGQVIRARPGRRAMTRRRLVSVIDIADSSSCAPLIAVRFTHGTTHIRHLGAIPCFVNGDGIRHLRGSGLPGAPAAIDVFITPLSKPLPSTSTCACPFVYESTTFLRRWCPSRFGLHFLDDVDEVGAILLESVVEGAGRRSSPA